MAIYDTEEEQLDQLKSWWAVNRNSLIGGVVGGLVLIAVFNVWQHYQTDTRNHASELYQQILNNSAQKNYESVIKVSEKLSTDYSSSAYAEYGVLQAVKAKVQLGDLEAAKTLLQNEIKNIDNPEIRHISRLRLVQLMLATKQYEEGLQLIAEVDPVTSEGYSASYDELQGDLYVALDRLDEARNAYQSAIRTGRASPLVQFKLDDISAPPLSERVNK